MLLLLTAVLTAAVSQAPGPAIALAALLGATTGVAMAVSNALLQKETDPRYLGHQPRHLDLSPLLYALTGVVAAWAPASSSRAAARPAYSPRRSR
ncbi:hypothetical protein QT196_07295 [Streptomyces sp. P9-2B-2]|uniref:hypothetical protein n=1 Tax=Streptomyces sp. P9-2B-2 TaxID=3057114 RepID=UPI0025B343E1|nr:hypothetical protein [Streptomyces sp. P9-2B-2]WJY37099.1 hypothetical protein QT196_07295 [Streptomyces sp. P9-2B-2]